MGEEEKHCQKPPNNGQNDALTASECTWESKLLRHRCFDGISQGNRRAMVSLRWSWFISQDWTHCTHSKISSSKGEGESLLCRRAFLNVDVHTNLLGNSLKCRLWFTSFGMEPKLLHLLKAPPWFWRQSLDCIFSSGESGDSVCTSEAGAGTQTVCLP